MSDETNDTNDLGRPDDTGHLPVPDRTGWFGPAGGDEPDAGLEDGFDAPDRLDAAHVNLLPPAYVQGLRRRRVGMVAVAILVVYLAGLGGVHALERGAVADARAERDVAEQRTAALRTEAESLQEYQTLIDTIDSRTTLLSAAMEDQLSWARIFGDLALTFDRQASLTEMSASSSTAVTDGEAAVPVDPATVEEPGENVAVGEVTFAGYSVDRFAPGVAEVIQKFDRTDGFLDTYLSLATDEERGGSEVTTFEGRLDLDDGAMTHRYDDGLPEEALE